MYLLLINIAYVISCWVALGLIDQSGDGHVSRANGLDFFNRRKSAIV